MVLLFMFGLLGTVLVTIQCLHTFGDVLGRHGCRHFDDRLCIITHDIDRYHQTYLIKIHLPYCRPATKTTMALQPNIDPNPFLTQTRKI